MSAQVIICPHCHKEIPLTEAIFHQIRGELLKEFEAESKKKEQEIAQKVEALNAREQALEDAKRTLDEEIAKKLAIEKEKLASEAKRRATEAAALEMKDLLEQIEEKDRKLEEARKAELELRRQRRALEEREKAIELEMARKLDEERARIKDEALKSATEEHRLKDLEKEKQINDMRKQIEDLKRKAEQGSQQTQGEVLELDLEEILKANFPLDHIEPVPKGIRGADVLQKVHNRFGQHSGMIIWESKRTKAWSDGWITKLKDDQREVKADVAILMTAILPKDVPNFGYKDGVWITDYESAAGLATSIRMALAEVAAAKLAAVGKNEKMEAVYAYIAGPGFKQKVQAIIETFASMKSELDQEKRAMAKIWAKREKQIERVIDSAIGMRGEVEGIIGASLPEIESLELRALTDGTDRDARDEEVEDKNDLPF
ncbi:MAG: DUF2130 domain-containing protein [Actinomycetota bacterium]